MAIFHCSVRNFSRADGHSAVAAAAYRAGTQLTDERRGFTHRYQHRRGIAQLFILAPREAPEHFHERAQLWNAAESAETRKNARVARELILALPHELAAASREALARDMALWLVERYRIAVDVAIHTPVESDGHDRRNHHAHLLFTTREVTKDGLGRKTRILDDKEQGPQEVELIRSVWETLANDALDRAGFSDVKIDRRTLEDQGIDRVPQIHVGPEAKAIEERKQEDEEEGEGKKDEDDKDGKGKKGKGGNGDSKAPNLNPSKAGDDSKGHKPDYKTIDQDRSRGDLVKQIKEVNTERAKWPDTPLAKQIRTLEHEMSRLDTRLRHYKQLETKTRLTTIARRALGKALVFSKEALTGRIKRRRALRLTEREKQIRINRQKERYRRNYKEGVHSKIKDMRTRLDILKATHNDYQKYKLFVDSIDRALAAQPIKPTFERQSRIITNQEHALKLHLKAALAAENTPERFRPPALPKKATSPHSQTRQASAPSQTASRGVKRAHVLFNQATSPSLLQAKEVTPVKILTREEVREKTSHIVAEIKRNIPPQFKAPPYPPQTPKPKKMSGAFNRAASGGAPKPAPSPAIPKPVRL